MKVFISWSGAVSHSVAIALRDWLPSVIQAVEPFVSSEDLERGVRWFTDIGNELQAVNFGILCITPQNITAPWVLFEAGALSKSVDQSRVTPLLVGLKNSDLEGPLAQFNTTSTAQSDIHKLIKTINNQLGASALPEHALNKAFEKWWPELGSLLESAEQEARKPQEAKRNPKRTQDEVLDELLELTRSISRQLIGNPEDDLNSALRGFLLRSRFKDLPADARYFLWSNLANSKGRELKPGEDWEGLRQLFTCKAESSKDKGKEGGASNE